MEDNPEHEKIVSLVRVPKGEITLADVLIKHMQDQEKKNKERAAVPEQLTPPF